MQKTIQRHTGKLLIAGVLLVFGASFVYAQHAATKSNEGIIIQDHVKGNPDAEIVVVKYGDFQCPFCAAAAPVVDELVAEFGDEVRFEYKHLPLMQIHPYAAQAAVAAEAAGQQGKFYEYHDLLYSRQNEWSRSPNPSVTFVRFAEELELDMELFRRHQGASSLKDKVQGEMREALRRGFTSTPTFTLNDERIAYAGLEQMQALLNDTLGRTGDTAAAPTATELEFTSHTDQ